MHRLRVGWMRHNFVLVPWPYDRPAIPWLSYPVHHMAGALENATPPLPEHKPGNNVQHAP